MDESENEDVEAYKQQIARLKTKVANATHRSDALMKEAHESHTRERQSRKEADQYRSELTRLRQRYHGMESDLKMNKLRNDCSVDRSKIGAMEAMVREIETDPNKNCPHQKSKVDQKQEGGSRM